MVKQHDAGLSEPLLKDASANDDGGDNNRPYSTMGTVVICVLAAAGCE